MNFCGFRRFNVNPSGAPRQLPLHKGAMSRCDFRLCATEKTNAESKFSKLKVCTLFFRGSAACQPLPSSERKVSRVSVTEGARETEKRRKTESLALSLSRSATAPSRREPLFVRVFFFVPQRKRKQKSRFQNSKSHFFILRQCSASTVAFLRGRWHAQA